MNSDISGRTEPAVPEKENLTQDNHSEASSLVLSNEEKIRISHEQFDTAENILSEIMILQKNNPGNPQVTKMIENIQMVFKNIPIDQDFNIVKSKEREIPTEEKETNTSISKISVPKEVLSFCKNPPEKNYSKDGWKEEGKLIEDFSASYIKNSEGKTKEIINEYFEKQKSTMPTYLEATSNIANNLPSIKEDCRISIAIPALGEESSIENTLKQFLQLNDSKKFEICILDTHPINSRDKTEEIIRKFGLQHPQLNIVYIQREVEENTNVAESRKFLTDIILHRVNHIKNKEARDNHIIVSQDADLELFENKDYINTIINNFAKSSKIELITGRTNLSREALIKAPAVLAAWRTFNTFDVIYNKELKTIHKSLGANTAIKARSLAGIGGYNPYIKLAEDLEIGWKLRRVKGNNSSKYSPGMSLQTEARRAYAAHLQGLNMFEMYNGFHENPNLRSKTWRDILQENPRAFEFSKEKYQKEVQALYDYANKRIHNGQYIFNETMKSMGVTYEVNKDNQVIITGLNKNIADVLEQEENFFKQEQ